MKVNLKHTRQELYKLKDYKTSHHKVLFLSGQNISIEVNVKKDPKEEFLGSDTPLPPGFPEPSTPPLREFPVCHPLGVCVFFLEQPNLNFCGFK